MLRICLIRSSVFFVLLFSTAGLHASQSNDGIENKIAEPKLIKTIEIMGLPFSPYIIVDDAGKASGILIDLLRIIFEQLEIKVKFKISNWARSYKLIQVDATDAIIPTMLTPERQAFLIYPKNPLLKFEMVLAGHSGRAYQFNGVIEQLRPYSIGRIRNAKVAPGFDKAIAEHKIQIEERNNIDLLVASIIRKRLDLVVMERRSIEWAALMQDQKDKIQILQPILAYQPVYIAFNKHRVSQELVDKVDAVLLELIKNGTLERIEASYF